MVRLIIFLNNILIMATLIDELTLTQDILIYLLLRLGFLINLKKSVLLSCQTLEFIRVEINSKNIILTLAEEKKKKIVEQCQFLLSKPPVTIKELTRVIGRLASTAIGVLPAPLQY